MNNGTTEATQVAATRSAARSNAGEEALTQAKRELLQAEVRLAKARATVVSAEIDIKTLTRAGEVTVSAGGTAPGSGYSSKISR